MKKRLLRYLAAFTAVLLTFQSAAFAEDAYEEAKGLTELRHSRLDIDESLALESGRYWDEEGSCFLAENYYVYSPGGEIQPLVSFGNDVLGAAAYAKALEIEREAGLNVLGGANADYFNMSTGVVLGPIIKDGLVCSSEHSSFEEIGFFGDGSAKMGRMGLNVEFTELVTGQVYSLMAYNKDLASRGGLVLFS
ncbi:MAG: hypothetical protein IJM17_06810, partial [Firmicutes bacterium]|nr:hypothetical protein [Bacillota bacterium]